MNKRDSTLIIIALPEGGIQRTDSPDAESQQVPIKSNTGNEQSSCCMCLQAVEQKSDSNFVLRRGKYD